MASKRLRKEDKAVIDARELLAGIRPLRSAAERVQIRSRQLREESQAAREESVRVRQRPDRP
jgi:outer membrane murein-binding lipoprotein Lpp